MSKRVLFLMLMMMLAGLVLVAGCGDDDDPVNPENFSFTLTVVDPAGDPVPGARIIMVPDLPYYQDAKAGAGSRAAVQIPFQNERLCDVELIIKDLLGETVFSWTQEDVQAGSHYWMWNGMDTAYAVDMPSGVYHARIVMRDTLDQALLFEDQEGMLLVRLDYDQEDMGTTDAEGRLILTDARLFPQVLDAEDQVALNEDGDELGIITFNGEMLFRVYVPGQGSVTLHRDLSGARSVELVFDPRAKDAGPELRHGPVGEEGQKAALIPPPIPYENRLYPPRPNPFN